MFHTSVIQVCICCDLIEARWLDGKCKRLLATALKVQHCWTFKTTVGDCWRQSASWNINTRDCRRLEYQPGLILLSSLYIELAMVCCTNLDNVHCFGTIFPNLNFVLRQTVPPVRPICNTTNTEVAQLSNNDAWYDPDVEQPKTAL